jgi:hypothetical protein
VKLEKQVILPLLKQLDELDQNRTLFGSDVHKYKLNPPAETSDIENFETTQSIVLPSDYRYFLTNLGNGGAGPYYGLFPLGMHAQGGTDKHCFFKDGFLVGDLSKPFPYINEFKMPEILDYDDEALLNEIEQQYWDPSFMNGAIPICDIGCAAGQWLVVTGEQAGYVWDDFRADYKGVFPARDENGIHLTFSNWYMSWLWDAVRNFCGRMDQ